jgi:hypothetical protein
MFGEVDVRRSWFVEGSEGSAAGEWSRVVTPFSQSYTSTSLVMLPRCLRNIIIIIEYLAGDCTVHLGKLLEINHLNRSGLYEES